MARARRRAGRPARRTGGRPTPPRRCGGGPRGTAEEPLERARLLEAAGRLAFQASRMAAAEERLRASVETFTAEGDTHAAARAAASLGVALWYLDRADEALGTLRPAFDALADEEHDVDIGKLAAELARIEYFTGDEQRASEHIELALDVAEERGDMTLLSQALNTKSLLVSRL